MSETVFILGAGCSKKAGAPLMYNFLDVAESLYKKGNVGNATTEFELIIKGLAALRLAQVKTRIDVDNVEAVFAAFEMAKLLGRLGTLSRDQINRLPSAMKHVIEMTLEKTIQLPVKSENVYPPAPYDKFVKLVHRMSNNQNYSKVSIITFNYDLCLDYAFHFNSIPINYCIDSTVPSHILKLLKLHGSLNWILCPTCGAVRSWSLADFFRNHDWRLLLGKEDEGSYRLLDIAGRLGEFVHCGKEPAKEPMIVPPTWNKSQYHAMLESIWSAAAEELTNAENIIIAGYSYPETDHFFHNLYALGTIGEARFKRFWVFDPDETIEKRFKTLLGQAAEKRYRFFKNDFMDSIGIIRSEFHL